MADERGAEDFMDDAEERAVRRVERAIGALPRGVALYFHGDNASVLRVSEGMFDAGGNSPGQDSVLGTISTPRCHAGDF